MALEAGNASYSTDREACRLLRSCCQYWSKYKIPGKSMTFKTVLFLVKNSKMKINRSSGHKLILYTPPIKDLV
jgi:hypothetical protein